MSLFDENLVDEGDERPSSDAPREDHVLSVSDLTRDIKSTLQSDFSSVWVTGEVTDLARPNSGHVYLTLKDDRSQIRGVIWKTTAKRIRFALEDGTQLLCRGDIDVYPPRGTYQLIIRHIEPRGEGALQRALKKLRAKLDAEGMFAPHLKKVIPKFPKRVGIITSPSGAALRDFLQVAARRWHGVELVIIPCRMQGEASADEVVQGIQRAHRLSPSLDALVITRGGGSIEDLWSFNEERVVRAIHAAKIPVVSAIGHEIDVTLADLVADLRALTPSEAAERVIPSANELQSRLDQLTKRLQSRMRSHLAHTRRQLDSLANRRVILQPEELVRTLSRRADELQLRSQRAMDLKLQQQREQLVAIAARLESLSPLSVLGRGYSVTTKDGQAVRSCKDLRIGDAIVTRISDGTITSKVEAIQTEEN